MKGSPALLVFAALAVSGVSGTRQLTASDFGAEVFDSGKNSFIKFYAPWCGHCKKLKPDWDKLAEKYEGSSSVLIGDVDCTVHQDLCSQHGVSGYPTLKYFKDGAKEGESYQQQRSMDALEKFVKDTLEIACDVNDPSGCTDKEKKYIDKMKAKGADAIPKEVERLGKMKGGSMKPELKAWLVARLNILNQLNA